MIRSGCFNPLPDRFGVYINPLQRVSHQIIQRHSACPIKSIRGSGVEPDSLALAGNPAYGFMGAPADGSADVPANPSLSWAAVSDASGYRVEMATDPAFINVVHSATVSDTDYGIPDGVLHDSTVYYWRVITPANNCGDEATPSTSSFTTRSRILACSKPGVAIPADSPVDDLLSVGATGTITDVDVYLGAVTPGSVILHSL